MKIFSKAAFAVVSSCIAFGSTLYAEARWLAGERAFDQVAMEGYKADPAFDYVSLRPEGISLWDQLWLWIFSLIGRLFGGPNGQNIGQILWLLFLVAVVAGAAYLVIKMQYGSVFSRSNEAGSSAFTVYGGSQQVDYNKLINEALEAGDLKMAIRYLYMKGLTNLSDQDLLKIRSWKTGADYASELSGDQKSKFIQLKQVFEYTWYGEFEPDETDVQLCKATVADLEKKKA
ncbi:MULTISPECIES: hypothetical protein [unclassified Imperialibacter]|uniref:hypothetical protein n=1 Tax=unclassified Imperialibacter TaxID=2629706 RepID=UPI00125C7CBC|nr:MULTISPECIES: hypothetical protein [unclassified Imperialibacter]CAD5280449.1 conserved hypothetical protein [Imperialibacter sp. 75]CAD5284685.1 conserved hypothetical protein [Imperialibacter sp. 89]VVT28223.1 conserved hypothetical protein [Imperialibacter sp. EC-SDR9]